MTEPNIHISRGQRQIERGYFTNQKELDPNFIRPLCNTCFKYLTVGDYVDGQHPYNTTYSICAKCDKKKKGKKK